MAKKEGKEAKKPKKVKEKVIAANPPMSKEDKAKKKSK
ncbi:hypothetical protein CLV62_13816 [Dysgonomonas alginatilytica]|uniref:Uncharacterized protein n=1 Tax=Dysgonomonas alginatilytica TaxID=1605892 RepID=A0A2V3PKT9_9BACT|nr:hypothetical protein CLV62_13816 [Dysgonomonas alginatilytica]